MLYKFTTRYLRISPRKIRFILGELKNQKINYAQEMLELRSEKAAKLILKSLHSAISASKNRGAIDEDLMIKSIIADEGPRLKRRLIKPRGRADLIMKRMSHLIIILSDKLKKNHKKKSKKI